MRRFALALVVATIAAIALSALAAPAGAHAALESSFPANGELLDEPPDEIRLAFTEPPDRSLTAVALLDSSGTEMATGPVEQVPGSDREIRVRLEPLADGVYTVTWRTVSSTDGHVTASAFSFGIGVAAEEIIPVPQTGDETPSPTAAAIAGRWSLYIGLVVLLGAGVTGLLALGPGVVARPWLLGLAWALAAVGVVLMISAERAAVGVPLGTLLSSEAGGKYVMLAVAVGIAGVAVLAAALRPGRVTLVALIVTAAGAMLARAAGGHAAGSPVTVLTQWVHFVGVGTWIGGLAWLVVGLVKGLAPAQIRRYSQLALIGLVIVVVSGVLRASNELGGFGWWLHAFDTSYGTTLVVKLGIVGSVIALGAVNRFRNIAHIEQRGPQPLLRTAGGEVALAVAVFAVTGLLTGLPPQPTQAEAPEPAHLVVTGSDFATTTKARLIITPGTVGPNSFIVHLTDYDTDEEVGARRVVLTFDLPEQPEVASELPLVRVEDGGWQAESTALALDGTWTVTVLVEQAAGSLEIPLEIPLEVALEPPEPQVDISEVPGQPTLYTFTLEGGLQIQAYLDPGTPGRTNQVHVTAFDAAGMELPLHHAIVVATPPSGSPVSPLPERLSPGHFVANMDLESGTWTFDLDVLTRDGQTFLVSFDQTFS